MVVGASGVEALELLITEVLVGHIVVTDIVVEVSSDEVAVIATPANCLSVGAVTRALLREVTLEMMHVHGAVVHLGRERLFSEVFFVGTAEGLLLVHIGEVWN